MYEYKNFITEGERRRKLILLLVFFIYFVDNMLLSVIVPIVPDYLGDKAGFEANITVSEINEISGKIGSLFASKSLFQLFFNPLVGWLTCRVQVELLIFCGILVFFTSALMFAAGSGYEILFFARSIHGVGSSLSVISGLALLAGSYHEDRERSRAMGAALSGMAAGVLVGYPAGGFMYDFWGKATPFLLIAAFSLLLIGFLLYVLRSSGPTIAVCPYSLAPVRSLIKDKYILICIASIGVSTLTIATLEPCLPVWLRMTVHPDEWQIGTAFIPDSLGYLIGTNLFGIVAIKFGRWLCAACSHIIVGICAIIVPLAKAMNHLIIPHFGIGLGIVIDASLMPLLACLVDSGYEGAYGAVYALSQTAVCFAYGFGPLLGGWLMGVMSFQGLIWTIGFVNLIFVIVIIDLRDVTNSDLLSRRQQEQDDEEEEEEVRGE